MSSRKQVIYQENNMNASIYGVTPSYLTVRNSEVEFGSFISESNISNIDKVAVLGATTASTLFGEENPIGKDVNIENHIFTVI